MLEANGAARRFGVAVGDVGADTIPRVTSSDSSQQHQTWLLYIEFTNFIMPYIYSALSTEQETRA